MSDNLTIFGIDYTGVTGVKVRETNGDYLTYVRPTGTKSITANGTGIDVASYASVDVAVPAGGADMPTFTLVMDSTFTSAVSITCDKTFAECNEYINDGVELALVEMTVQGDEGVYVYAATLWSTSVSEFVYVMAAGGVPFAGITMDSASSCTLTMQPPSVTTLAATTNGTYTDEYGRLYSEVTVNVPSGSPSLQSKTATPTESQQTVTPDSGYDGLSSVTVGAVSSTYVGSGITRRTSSDLTASGATVTVPAGHYAAQASKAVASGTEGTPTATKGSVSNHAVTVTPSVTNSAGYIAGGTHNGTGVTVQASELVSGTKAITGAGTTDVTEYASASVASGGATPSATKGAVSNHSVTVTPSVTRTAGWVSAGTSNGTAVTVSASELVSGSQTITDNGTVDVTNLASVTVDIDFVTYHTSSSAPTSSQGSDGDVWLVTS